MSLGLLVSGQLSLVILKAIDFGPWSIPPGGKYALTTKHIPLLIIQLHFLRTFLIKTLLQMTRLAPVSDITGRYMSLPELKSLCLVALSAHCLMIINLAATCFYFSSTQIL